MKRPGRAFFDRDVHTVARELIGCSLFVEGRGGVIVETESYAEDDPACHAYNGMTARNRSLFGMPGTAYVYRSYGIHNLLNFVAEPSGKAAAVLIRALEPTHGIVEMRARRDGRPTHELCSGPGKLTRAIGIGLELDGSDLLSEPFELLRPSRSTAEDEIITGPRIGISKATDLPWRFCLAGSRYVSPPHPPFPDQSEPG